MKNIKYKKSFKTKITRKKVKEYIRGHLRMFCYYNHLRFLIRPFIREQIEWRIDLIKDTECYLSGECVVCKCATPALQFANKACDKPCYPKLIKTKWIWKNLKRNIDNGVDVIKLLKLNAYE